MKKRSEKKRQAILEAAYSLFSEKGFEKTSMSEINERLGGSKATIYGYFPSKEQLFVECMVSFAETYLEDIFSELQKPVDDLPSALQTFGINLLRAVCSAEVIRARRLMIAEAERANVGSMFYEKLMSFRQQVALFLSGQMAEGRLRSADANLAAEQLRALLEAEILDPRLLNVETSPPSEEAIANASARAVETFLRAYASEHEREDV